MRKVVIDLGGPLAEGKIEGFEIQCPWHGSKFDIRTVNDIENRYSRLESWAKDHFPIEDIEYQWSGQVMEPKDLVAFIGHDPRDNRNNIYIATGDSGNELHIAQ